MKQVEVDKIQCKNIGEIVRTLKFRPEFYDRKFLKLNANKEKTMLAYLFASAICHQTHSLWNAKLNLKGWDYLEYVFGSLAKKNSKLLNIDYLNSITRIELSEKLKPLFSEDSDPNDCTLDKLIERSDFILDITKVLYKKYNSKLSNLINISGGYLKHKISKSDNQIGLYNLLRDFKAFQDPTCKKSTVFIKLLVNSGLIQIKDPKNFVPDMDYHIQRVMLRMGCIEILNEELKQKLVNKQKIESDTEIRNACIDAVKIIADDSGYPSYKMNNFFWPLGRSCCKELLLCQDHKCNKNPCTFELAISLKSHKNCIFVDVCKASSDPLYQKLWQPQVETNYY
ncbi:MAG: hypothetical protein ACD_58C00092G0014 [uncultured bacterium]|nr:MAG: hypothetical protein ACD_58C00092G0014 [uncultured bacterium]